MEKWIETFHCKKHTHCGTCRLTNQAGEKWRGEIAKVFDVEQLNWECPEKIEWNINAEKIPDAISNPQPKCKYEGEQFAPAAKPCMGNEIECLNPKTPDGCRWWSGWCKPKKCKFFTA